MNQASTVEINERIIRPKSGLVAIDFSELWRYRELFLQLAWRNILIRYKQTYLGISWAILQPLLTTVVFTVIFGKMAKLPDLGVPYAVLTFAGLLPWQFFANALTESSNSLVMSQGMVTKIYFPRIVLPAAAVLSGCVDFLISLGLLVGFMIWYSIPPTPTLLLLPFFFAAAFLASIAVGIWFSALNVKYRDVKYIVPFIVRIGFFASPVAFLSNLNVPEKWLLAYNTLNPMAGIIEGFRFCILGSKFQPYWPGFWAGMAVILFLFITGAYYFRTTEKTFADVI
jgi:lipopolysaccharide transport system permease protein